MGRAEPLLSHFLEIPDGCNVVWLEAAPGGWPFLRHDEQGNTPGPGRGTFDPRQYQVDDIFDPLVIPPGDKDLLTRNFIVISFGFSRGSNIRKGTPGLGLRQAHGPTPPTFDHRRDVHLPQAGVPESRYQFRSALDQADVPLEVIVGRILNVIRGRNDHHWHLHPPGLLVEACREQPHLSPFPDILSHLGVYMDLPFPVLSGSFVRFTEIGVKFLVREIPYSIQEQVDAGLVIRLEAWLVQQFLEVVYPVQQKFQGLEVDVVGSHM